MKNKKSKKLIWEKVAHVNQCVLDKYVVVEGFKKYLPKLLSKKYAIFHFKFVDSEIFYDYYNRINIQKSIKSDIFKNCRLILDVQEKVGREFITFSRRFKKKQFFYYD